MAWIVSKNQVCAANNVLAALYHLYNFFVTTATSKWTLVDSAGTFTSESTIVSGNWFVVKCKTAWSTAKWQEIFFGAREGAAGVIGPYSDDGLIFAWCIDSDGGITKGWIPATNTWHASSVTTGAQELLEDNAAYQYKLQFMSEERTAIILASDGNDFVYERGIYFGYMRGFLSAVTEPDPCCCLWGYPDDGSGAGYWGNVANGETPNIARSAFIACNVDTVITDDSLRGKDPSKMLEYPAEVLSTIGRYGELLDVKRVHSSKPNEEASYDGTRMKVNAFTFPWSA